MAVSPSAVEPRCRTETAERSRTARCRVFGALLLLMLPTPCAFAQPPRSFCAAAERAVLADAQMSEAIRAAYGPSRFTSTGAACLFPLKVIHYAGADILLTQDNVPGEACHGCSATLSAHVLQRTSRGLRLVKTLPGFAKVGSFGAATAITPLTIGGDDGLAVESGGTFQGYSFTDLDIYVFRAGRAVHLQMDPAMAIAADDAGAVADDGEAVRVTGSWSLDPASNAAIVVNYRIDARGRTRMERVVWGLRGTRLVVSSGHVPPEMKTARGGGR